MEFRPILSALMRSRTGPLLVASQVALSLAILVNTVHIVSDNLAATARPSGVADYGTLFHVGVVGARTEAPAAQVATQQRNAAALRAVPGAVSVAQISNYPLRGGGYWLMVRTALKEGDNDDNAAIYNTADSVVKTWGLTLVEGRDFVPGDVTVIDDVINTPDTVIVSRAMAAKLFPGQASVVGKTVYVGIGAGVRPSRIIGVVEHLQTPSASTDETAEFSLVFPARVIGGGTTYSVRAEAGQRERVIRDAEAALRAASSTPLVIKTITMDEVFQDRYRGQQAMAAMLITVSLLLLLITASGIVGMASLWVTQRHKQIGVRRALGARRIDILRYFLLENLIITSAGVVVGVLLAIGLNQLLVSQFEMSKLPLSYLLAGPLVFWTLGVLAVYPPAWRGASTSPAVATRST